MMRHSKPYCWGNPLCIKPGRYLNNPAARPEQPIYVRNDVFAQLESFYEKLLELSYSAEVVGVDYSQKEAACEKVNGWVDEHTRGMIREILSPDSIDHETKLVLVNTVFFKGS